MLDDGCCARYQRQKRYQILHVQSQSRRGLTRCAAHQSLQAALYDPNFQNPERQVCPSLQFKDM